MTIAKAESLGRSQVALSAWLMTVAATVGSTVVIDVVATGTGLAVSASGAFAGQPGPVVLGFVVAGYAAWAAAMRVNIEATWRLLDETGACTNAVAKLGFDWARRRGRSARAERLATAIGYVAREVAMEAPYYLAAFGTAAASDYIDGTHALVFVGRANFGAAGYEYVAARCSHGYLDHRSRRVAAKSVAGPPADEIAGTP